MRSVTLLIDKRRELSVKYKKLLETFDNKVIISKDLISAIKIIQDNEPDLILISDSIDSDLSDYCKKIRALTYNMRPVIVALSKSDDLQDKLNVLQNGADDYLGEPVNNEEFVMRIKAHLRRSYESNLDNNKIIPNKNYSLRALKRIIKTDTPWASMLISIDNFEIYKEIYGELASDKLVKTFCAIIQSALVSEDYFGQISDSEFLVITDIYKAEKVANYLAFIFESVSTKFYSQDDLARGYLILQGDDYTGQRADFVHTTIGVVTNEYNQFTDITQLINMLVQIKNMAFVKSKSNFLIDRQKIPAQNLTYSKEYNNKIAIVEKDEALKLLLKTILELQGYEITENDNFPAIIILDWGENGEGEFLCKKIKQDNNYLSTKIIVTSTRHSKETILDCGADLYIPKPYEISHLIKWIEKFMREINR